MKEWKLVEKIQKLRPGWRFMLIGGDKSMGYKLNKNGSFKRGPGRGLVVDESSRIPFGWRAEFFGDEDPRICDGSRHAIGSGQTAEQAVVRACAAAMLRIQESP